MKYRAVVGCEGVDVLKTAYMEKQDLCAWLDKVFFCRLGDYHVEDEDEKEVCQL